MVRMVKGAKAPSRAKMQAEAKGLKQQMLARRRKKMLAGKGGGPLAKKRRTMEMHHQRKAGGRDRVQGGPGSVRGRGKPSLKRRIGRPVGKAKGPLTRHIGGGGPGGFMRLQRQGRQAFEKKYGKGKGGVAVRKPGQNTRPKTSIGAKGRGKVLRGRF